MRHEDGSFLDKKPADLFTRVARFIASGEKTKKDAEAWAKKFFDAMMAREFLPNSPTLTGAGRGHVPQRLLRPADRGLARLDLRDRQNAALVHKEGGGTGFDFSRLRPKGSFVKKNPGHRLGAGVFPPGHRLRDRSRQAGRHAPRRQHGHPRVDHPDIEEFIRMKINGKSVKQFQPLGRGNRRLHGGAQGGRLVRYLRPLSQEGRRPEKGQAGLRTHRRVGLGGGRSGSHLSSTGSTPGTRRRASAPSGPRTRAASSRSTSSSPATWGRST